MIYDINYYDNLLRDYSGTAELICRKRWDFVSRIDPILVLDYGCGVGWFRAFAPYGVTCDTYDIMPVMQTGIRHNHYDLITFWDSLEHLHHADFSGLFDMGDAIALTIPIKPDHVPLESWKHWKPKEHVFLPDEKELIGLFSAYGFRLFDRNQHECPPRVDIHAFLFVRSGYVSKKVDSRERAKSWGFASTDYCNKGSTYELSGRVPYGR